MNIRSLGHTFARWLMAQQPYNTPEWQRVRERVLARDGNRCTVARLLGGECSHGMHVHHLIPVSEGGNEDDTNLVTVCSTHHPKLEALRRYVQQERPVRWKRCRHRHTSREARLACERRLNRDQVAA